MSHDTTAPKRRISGGTSIAMVAVALVFDFAVLIMLVMGVVLSLSMVGDGFIGAVGAALFLGAEIMTFPIIAAMVSAIAGVLSVLIFTVWFAALRVHVMGLSYRRAMINLTTMVIESIPVLNLLPMQTVAVILHICITNKEDDKKIKEHGKKHEADKRAVEARKQQEYAAWRESAAVV